MKNEEYDILPVLAQDFVLVLQVSCSSRKLEDVSTVCFANPEFMRWLPEWSRHATFSAQLDYIEKTLVVPEDQANFHARTRREQMIEALSRQNVYRVNFRIHHEGEIRHYCLKYGVLRGSSPDRVEGFVVAIFNVNDVISRVEEAAIAKGTAAAQFLCDIYTSVYHRYLKDDAYDVVSRLPEVSARYGVEAKFMTSFQRYCDEEVHLEDRARILAAAEPRRVRRMLLRRSSFSEIYRCVSGGDVRWWEISFHRIEGSPDEAIMTFADVDADVRNERRRDEAVALVDINSRAMERALLALQSEQAIGNLKPFLEIVRSRFDADNCHLCIFDRARRIFELRRGHCVLRSGHASRGHWFIAEGDLFQEGRASHLDRHGINEEHAEALARIRRGFGMTERDVVFADVVRFFAVPIYVRNEFWGYIGLCFKRSHVLTAVERNLFRNLVSVLEGALELRDIYGELERKNAALERALDEARRAERAKSVFLATMSHEIRTPLNAIIGFSDFLSSPRLSKADQADYLAGIRQSSHALLALINDILDLSKLESGKMAVKGGRTDVTALMGEMRAVFKFQVAEKKLDFNCRTTGKIPVLALQEERLRQILLNLVGNAVKFTAHGSISLTAAWHGATHTLILTVADTGVGISRAAVADIFDPFVQDGSDRGGKVYAGTGLGLPIVKRLAEAAGGTVRVDSEEGVGSTFTVTLPDVAVVPGGGERRPRAASGRAKAAATGPKCLKHTFVLVDDVRVNLRILRQYLVNLGIAPERMVEFSEAKQALVHLKAHAREAAETVVLTDMWMPGMNGEDFARALRREPLLSGIPVFGVTADIDSSSSFDVSLFAGILTKPITAEQLDVLIERLRSGKESSK